MNYDWMLDVLTDLSSFAEANGMARLAERLDETRRFAALEIADMPDACLPAGPAVLLGSGQRAE